MKTLFSLSIIMSLSMAVFAQSKEIEAIAEIKSVTIYNSSAEINYQKEISLPQGKSVVVFTDLSPFIVPNTINVSTSSPDVDIITVTEKINYTKEKKEQNVRILALQDSILRLENEIGFTNCKIEAFTKEKGLLFNGESIGGVAKGVAVTEIEKASAFFSKRYLELTTDLYKLAEKVKAIEVSLAKCTNQLNELSANTQKASSEIQLTVINSSSKSVMFSFKYLTPNAGWAPSYDCKYQGSGKPLQFVFKANVFNASGTPWENVDIKLSTASPTEGFDAPSLNAQQGSTSKSNRANANGVKFVEIEVSNSIAEYDIKHKYSIPSDSKPYLIDVNSYTINAEYSYLIIPKVDPFGFLIAKIPGWNKYNLIPGNTNIYNKGSFMGKTFLNTYTENDTLSLYLGKDNNIQAIRKEVAINNQTSLIGNYNIEKSAINIMIKNNSAEMLSIQVLDQVPVYYDNEKVKITIENIDQANINKVEGLLTWNFQLKQNESKTVEFKYEAKIPKSDYGRYSNTKKSKMRSLSCPSF
ncbi:MAG: DUF4139 domain-containing protein [Bacteroidota bacterium]